MKKIILVICIVLLNILMVSTINHANAQMIFNATSDVSISHNGVTHRRIEADIQFRGTRSVNMNAFEPTRQHINLLIGNVTNNPDLMLMMGDNFNAVPTQANIGGSNPSMTWGMGTVPQMINNINFNNPHLRVVGGVNGAAYLINTTGQPTSLTIKDFRVINRGWESAPSLGYRDDGSVVIGTPQFVGAHLNVFNMDEELKYQTPVVNNRLPNAGELAVIFPNFGTSIPAGLTKHIFQASNMKFDNINNRNSSVFFGEGTFIETTTEEIQVELNQFVVVGDGFDVNNILRAGDFVIVQDKIVGEWANVRHALGMWQTILTDGNDDPLLMQGDHRTMRHPRTAIGLTADGTIVMMVVDGRNPGIQDGVNFAEMALLFRRFGVVTAFNLDGGGSSTFVMENPETSLYPVINRPSDSGNPLQPRRTANGLFFVVGTPIPFGTQISWPDERQQLVVPNNIYIGFDGVITFDEVDGASGYMVYVGNRRFFTPINKLALNIPVGNYQITVRAMGSSEFAGSIHSEIINFQMLSNEALSVLNIFRGIGRNW